MRPPRWVLWWRAHAWVVRVAILVIASPPLWVELLGLHSPAFTGVMCRITFVILLMAGYWITEALPLAVTALLPLALFPVLGILSAEVVSTNYFNDTLFLLLGSFFVALAMEEWDLHRRIALKFILYLGEKPRVILGGFMAMTAFLSMWLNNSATTSLMVPIALAILHQIKEATGESTQLLKRDNHTFYTLERNYTSSGERETSGDQLGNPASIVDYEDSSSDDGAGGPTGRLQHLIDSRYLDTPAQAKQRQQVIHTYTKGLLLGIAYSASIGGTATIIGTNPNLILLRQVGLLFPEMADVISFFNWMIFAFPLAAFFVALLFLCFVYLYCPPAAQAHYIKVDTRQLKEAYHRMGPMSFPQKVILVDFVGLALLWFSRKGISDLGIPGWQQLFSHPSNYISDGTVSMAAAIVLFFIPSRQDPARNILDWQQCSKLPWDVIILIGGGFALARGISSSGLSLYLAQKLQVLQQVPVFLMLFIICFFTVGITELTSNSATASMLLPILAVIAVSIEQNPLLLMIPATISCSYAFMLPVATPPNAIIFASQQLKVTDMARAGLLANLIGLVLLAVAAYFFIPPVFL